jgi:hypothetical protein
VHVPPRQYRHVPSQFWSTTHASPQMDRHRPSALQELHTDVPSKTQFALLPSHRIPQLGLEMHTRGEV